MFELRNEIFQTFFNVEMFVLIYKIKVEYTSV